jgi:serine/threonine-protein kinase
MRAGFVVRDYVLEEKIGEGGMGEVWRSRHQMLNKPVAIKVMAEQLLADPSFEARFIHEAQAQARLQHPQIIGATDFFREQGRYYLVMPMIEGYSLEERLKRGPMPIEEALWISADVLAALDYAHQQAVIHRDVKPSNILIDRNGRAYLTDFGIALMMGQERKTRTGIAIGTTHYMSPEQIRRPRGVDHRTDVYSFGCVLYEMLTGRTPFEVGDAEEDTDYVIKEAHVHRAPEPLRRFNPSIPQTVEAIVMRALAKNPDERFVSCGEFAREFMSAMQIRHPQVIPSAPVLPPPGSGQFQQPPVFPTPGSGQFQHPFSNQQAYQQQRAQMAGPLARPVRNTAWLLLGLSILFASPITAFAGVIGIVGAIGMLKGRDWGRRVGLAFSLLLEVAGLVVAFGVVIYMGTEAIRSYDVEELLLISIMAMASAFIGIILALRLGREPVMQGLGNNSKRPAGILPIAIPALLTGFGTIPAIELLRKGNWGRIAMMICLWIFAILFIIAGIGLGSGMRIETYNWWADSYWDRYSYSSNEGGFALAVIEAIAVAILCVIASFYLKSSSVKSWCR